MNAVGIDVSKGKSMVAIMRPFGEIVSSPFEIKHTTSDINSLVELINYYNIFMGNPLTSGKDLSISLLKLLECRMQWYIDFITWTSRPYFRLITGFSFAVFVLCRLNHIRCIRVTHSSLNR